MNKGLKEILESSMYDFDVFIKNQQLVLYLPHKDKNDNEIIDINSWIKKAQLLASFLGGGSTTMPQVDGTWLKNDIEFEHIKDEDIIWEKTTIIYSYINSDKFQKNIDRLLKFLCDYGKMTNQGEVIFEFDGYLCSIKKFD